MLMQYEVVYGHRAVWVNTSHCLGRFGVNGIDVHRSLDEQMDGKPQCLFCTHGPVTRQDWPRFVEAMRLHHQIDLSDSPVPAWLESAQERAI